jgi:chromosome segregation ATPase
LGGCTSYLISRVFPASTPILQREIGALQYRINQLREEIGWAELEISKGREEADSWRRVVVARESKIALLFLELKQLQEDAQIARARSRKAAEESFEPTELAEKKYVEAWTAARRATEMEASVVELSPLLESHPSRWFEVK